MGRAMAIADARILDEEGKLLARGTGIYQIPRPKQGPQKNTPRLPSACGHRHPMGAVRAAGGRGPTHGHQPGQRRRAPRTRHHRRSLQLRRGGHPAPPGLGCARISLWPGYRRGRRLLSHRLPPGRTPRVGPAGRQRPPTGLHARDRRRPASALAAQPGIFAPWPAMPPPRPPWSRPTGSCATSPTAPSKRWPGAATEPPTSSGSTGRPGPASSRRSTTRRTSSTSAAEALRKDETAARRLGTVIVYLPERLSRHGGALLGAVAEASEVVVLAGTTGDARADAEVERSVRRIATGWDPDAPRRWRGLDSSSTDRTRILTVSDCDEEVRAAVRCVVDAARAGTPLDRMAILHASPGALRPVGP